jgi:protein TonB
MVVERDGLTARARVEVARGRVVLKVLVRADGTVAAVEVAQSSADPALDGAAAAAAWTWRFRPATRDDTPIAAWALVPVVFE